MTVCERSLTAPDLDRSAIFRLSAGAALLAVGDRTMLFSAESEKLFELNDAAAAVASILEGGATFEELADILVGDGIDEGLACPMIVDLLRKWSFQGVVDAAFPPIPLPMHRRQSIRIAGVHAELRYSSVGLERKIAPAYEHLSVADDGGASVIFEIVEADGLVLVNRQGGRASVGAGRNVAPYVKGLLVEEILAASPPCIALHAACLAHRGGALLLSGAPGTGKSTLATALSHAGLAYVADDITLLRPDGLIQGVPFAPSVKRGAWPLLRGSFPGLSALPIHRRRDGVSVRYLPIETNHAHTAWLKVENIVHLRRMPGASAQLLEREPAEALAWLIEEAHSTSGAAKLEDLQVFIAVAQRARRYDLIYSDLDDAVQTLINACADG